MRRAKALVYANQLQIGLGRVGLPGLALFAVVAVLKEWDRKSELSADRAGLLCVQDPATSYRILERTAPKFHTPLSCTPSKTHVGAPLLLFGSGSLPTAISASQSWPK